MRDSKNFSKAESLDPSPTGNRDIEMRRRLSANDLNLAQGRCCAGLTNAAGHLKAEVIPHGLHDLRD